MKDKVLLDITAQRIKTLFNLAVNAENIELSRRYITIMEKLAMRMTITLDRNIKLSYCKKCKTPYQKFDFRLKNNTLTVKCHYCGDVRHIQLTKKN